MTTPQPQPQPSPEANDQIAPPPAQGSRRITDWIKRHAKGVVIGAVMGLGLMAIAGGGLGGYVAYVKQKAPAAVQGTVVTEAPALIVGGAETAARVVVGGPGSGSAPAPEQAVPPVSLVIVEKNFQQASDGGPDTREVVTDGAYQINENNGAGGWFKIKAVMNGNQTADTVFTLAVDGYGSSPATYDNDYETFVPPGTAFTVPAGQSESPAQRVTVRARCDHQAEGDEMLSIKFVNQARNLQSNAILINIVDNCVPNEYRTPAPQTEDPTATPTATPTPTPMPTRLPDRISISFSTSTSNSITVNWTEPNLNGSTMESYIVGHRVGGQDNLSWVDGPNLPTSERSYTIENLRPDTAYEIAVGYKVASVYHRTGWIHFTSTRPIPTPVPTATPVPTPTPDPAQTPPGPVPYVGLYGSSTDQEIIATWPAPTTGGPVAAYNVCINLHGSDRKDCVDTADRMHTFSDLAPGAYWITVTAQNSHGESEPQREGIELAPPPKD